MVLNAAVQLLREADELKEKILKFKVGTSILQERSLWGFQQELQKVYQKVLVLDLDYALDKKVEQDLWNVGFKQQIEALQAISKDKKNQQRSEGQATLSWVLQAAAGFYLCLLHQICTTFKLDLPFRRRASLLGLVQGWAGGAGAGRGAAAAAARYAAQHCLVHLGDLARYRQQLRVAHTFYRHALVVSPHSGQPYNQLALVSWRRGRRLAALYWHARSLLVKAPFPPAPINLARTLQAAAKEPGELPVLPGIAPAPKATAPAPAPRRLDAHSYISQFIRALHLIYTQEDLDTAAQLVEELNSSLTALVATDSFESMALIKMAVVIMWLVDWSTENLTVAPSAQTAGEARAAALSQQLAAGAVLALLLPAYTAPSPPQNTLPPLYVWLQWLSVHICSGALAAGAGLAARPQLWPALAHALNALRDTALPDDTYDTAPLSEDTELYGFVPLERAHAALHFADYAAAAWDAPPDLDVVIRPPSESAALSEAPALARRVRARRLLQLARALAAARPDLLTASDEDKPTFTSTSLGTEQLTEALAALSLARLAHGGPGQGEGESDSDSDSGVAPTPTVISEADFREKVREKRVGILKPQGSLERAREERALAINTQEDDEPSTDESRSEEPRQAGAGAGAGAEARERRARTNVAMAAILRKQEESAKQVKFVTPPPTPDATPDTEALKDADKPKVIQPKVIKSLANLPIGVKTGGILCLKDKSAGYPHLVNTDPEPKKPEKEEQKEPKVVHQHPSQSSQQYPKPPPQNWVPNVQPAYEQPRMNFQNKNAYGIQNTGLNYSPNYQANAGNQGIRLPVVNPKEIDVRTAAMQKQNSRQEFTDRPGYMTGDKKNFLSDLPPRFANQYRYWQPPPDSQLSQDNKFRDDTFPAGNAFNQPPRPWGQDYQQPPPPPWWKPDTPNYTNPNFSAQPMNAPNYFTQNSFMFNQKPEAQVPSYLQPQMPSMQNLVTSPNYNSMNFGYQPPTYDAAMYPQFNKMNFQPNKEKNQFQTKELIDVSGLGFGNMQLGNLNMNYTAPSSDGSLQNMEQATESSNSEAATGSTYSLFSGAPQGAAAAWTPRPTQQSLWSGAGPSALERLLEQQKQMKPPEPH